MVSQISHQFFGKWCDICSMWWCNLHYPYNYIRCWQSSTNSQQKPSFSLPQETHSIT